MATSTGKIPCVKCNKGKATLRCAGCMQEFCHNHLNDHQQELHKQFDEVEVSHDLLRQMLNDKLETLKSDTLAQRINEWENDSIKKIRQTAEETRQILLKNVNEYIHPIEIDLNKLTDQLRETRQENDFNEIGLRQFQEELNKLKVKLSQSLKNSLQEDSTPLINKIFVDVSVYLYQHDPDLVRMFKNVDQPNENVRNNDIIAYIRQYMDPSEQYYIRTIVLSYLEACLINNTLYKKIQENIAIKRIPVLDAIIEHNPQAEIQAVYAIQNFVSKLEHPPKMARLLFDIFYDHECISEDTFFKWLKHPDPLEAEGHAVVAMSTKDFFTWLQQGDSETDD